MAQVAKGDGLINLSKNVAFQGRDYEHHDESLNIRKYIIDVRRGG